MIQQLYLWLYNQKNWKQGLKEIIVHSCYSNIIHNTWKQSKWPLMDEWINKNRYSGILFNLRKEENSDICYNVDEPWRNYAKWKKPFNRKTNSVWLHSYEGPRVVKLFIYTKSRMVVARGRGRGKLLCNGYGFCYWRCEEYWRLVDCNVNVLSTHQHLQWLRWKFFLVYFTSLIFKKFLVKKKSLQQTQVKLIEVVSR